MMPTVGIVGLGRMGMAMAERFVETGMTVVATDLSAGTMAKARDNGIETVDSALEVFRQTDIALLSLPTAKDVRAIVGNLKKEAVGHELYIVDTTTSDPIVTRELEPVLRKEEIHLVDAPVSGGFFGARAGTLGIMVGGAEADVEHCMDVLSRIGGKVVRMGDSGAGHATKLLNNLLAATNLLVASEIVQLGNSLGLSSEKLISVLNAGAARNGATEVNYPRWILSEKYDSGFTARLMRKDVALADELIVARGGLPLLAEVASLWAASNPAVDDDADFNQITGFHPTKGSAQ
jgi:3-hydroxyisobutyrate dehydrogenase